MSDITDELCPVCGIQISLHTPLELYQHRNDLLQSIPELYELCIEEGNHELLPKGRTCEKCGWKRPNSPIGY